MRINKYQKELTQVKQEWDRCEEIQKTSHEKADSIRELLNKELGLPQEIVSPQRT